MITFRRVPQKGNLSFLLIVFFCLSWLVGTQLMADCPSLTYHVFGSVFSATPLLEGEEEPNNILSGINEDLILGENRVAQVERNMIKVSIIKESDGSLLGLCHVFNGGGFSISFCSQSEPVDVRFIVEDLISDTLLFESEITELQNHVFPYSPNIRYLLVVEEPTEIGPGGNDFPQCVGLQPNNCSTGLFTRVGKIEVQSQGSEYLIDQDTGLATVSLDTASLLGIPQYQKSPFGGNLFLFGAFSQQLYALANSGSDDIPPIYYRIRVEKFDDYSDSTHPVAGTEDPGATETFYVDDPLAKTKYTVNYATYTVDSERIVLGPFEGPGEIPCYKLTPLSSGNVFWSFPDLLAIWRTGSRNGYYRIVLEVIDSNDGSVHTSYTLNDNSSLRLRLDNTPPQVSINEMILPGSGETTATPAVFTGSSEELETSTFYDQPFGINTDYNYSQNQLCDILTFPNLDAYLAFNLTVHQSSEDEGFLRYWWFSYKRNDYGNYEQIISQNFSADPDQMTPGINTPNDPQTSTFGFENKFLYLSLDQLIPFPTPASPENVAGCAYRFLIYAGTRTTDGYRYLSYAYDEDLHYLQW